jgi:hypothetical protein
MKNIVRYPPRCSDICQQGRQPHFIKIVDRTRPLPNPFWLAENRVLEMSDGDVRLIDTFETLCRTLNAQTFYFDYNRSTDGSRRLRHCKLARA